MRIRAETVATLIFTGALTWVAVPNLYTAKQRSMQKRSMADIRTIATAWEARASDSETYFVGSENPVMTAEDANDFARATVVELAELKRALEPTYVRAMPELDAWRNPFELRVAGLNEEGKVLDYAIRSLGRGGKADRDHYTRRFDSSFEADLVFSNGNFIQMMEGI